jgi:hypothetical protein
LHLIIRVVFGVCIICRCKAASHNYTCFSARRRVRIHVPTHMTSSSTMERAAILPHRSTRSVCDLPGDRSKVFVLCNNDDFGAWRTNSPSSRKPQQHASAVAENSRSSFASGCRDRHVTIFDGADLSKPSATGGAMSKPHRGQANKREQILTVTAPSQGTVISCQHCLPCPSPRTRTWAWDRLVATARKTHQSLPAIPP